MKGLVLLAMLLMVPAMAYYQKHTYADELQAELEEEVRRVLSEEGVENPACQLVWLDARISGVVETADRRRAVGERVDQLPGLRLPERGNGLRVRGWIGLAREQGAWRAIGLMPKGFELEFLAGVEQETPWNEELESTDLVESPPQLAAWRRFLEGYFADPGNRSALLRGGRLVLAGEATVGTRSDFLASASRVVDKERVEDQLVVQPSVYHFAGYVPESSRSAGEVKRLREDLGGLTLRFGEGAAEVDVDERQGVAEVARVMLQTGERVRYVVGATVPAEAEVGLGRRRIDAVVALLKEYGVREEQLTPEVFVGGAGGEVEFLLK